MTQDAAHATRRDGSGFALAVILLTAIPLSALARQSVLPALLLACVAVVASVGPASIVRIAVASNVWRMGAVLLAWAGVSLLWGSPEHTAVFLRVAATIAAAGVFTVGMGQLPEGAMNRAARFTLIGGLILALFLFEEGVTGAAVLSWLRPLEAMDPGTIFNLASRGTTVLAVLAFILAALLFTKLRSRIAALGFVVAAFAACWLLTTAAATLAIALGAVAFVLAYFWPRFIGRLTVGVLVFGVLFAPMLPGKLTGFGILSPGAGSTAVSMAQRVAIWNNTATMILDKPVVGYGFNASRDFAMLGELIPGTDLAAMPLHPHNGALQIWFELGLVGAALFCVLIVMAGKKLRALESRPLHAATAVATLISAATIFMLSFSIWQFWWMAALGLTGGLLAMTLKVIPPRA